MIYLFSTKEHKYAKTCYNHYAYDENTSKFYVKRYTNKHTRIKIWSQYLNTTTHGIHTTWYPFNASVFLDINKDNIKFLVYDSEIRNHIKEFQFSISLSKLMFKKSEDICEPSEYVLRFLKKHI